ncbi:endophilin-B1 isoform X1 [Schistocerca piceifrons]|uniref:endophilin-B1 isoform X1 n=1 Tax=Schistocerca piceifrons TaxID=274613 RepID=UPI001F5FC71D|nr:endophilin-B1 isoform X1 [Schistocerca piceifrons]XP_049964672.1 endophilin-B1 isoform X1 [Schistocerca serialis cubense]
MDMDFNVKKLVRDAGTAISRVVQLTEEKLGTSEKTELDAHFENLAERSDTTKLWTEKILRDTEAVLTPNPGNRVEDFLFEKIEKKRPNRLTNLEYLGLDMIEAGNEFGPGTAYGSALVKVGQCEQRLGQTEREFISSAGQCFIQPLRKFLDGEMKTILKERSLLESKRLDLDACKNRLRKARSMHSQQNKEGVNPEVLIEQAEKDLRVAQSEFDRQAEITKLLLEGISSSHASHLRCLHEFVEAQVRYYDQCHHIMQELQRDLSSLSLKTPGVTPFQATTSHTENHHETPKSGYQRARVLYDYDAKDATELSLMADEVITICEISVDETDYFMGERGSQKGKVPKAFLEIINP